MYFKHYANVSVIISMCLSITFQKVLPIKKPHRNLFYKVYHLSLKSIQIIHILMTQLGRVSMLYMQDKILKLFLQLHIPQSPSLSKPMEL